MSTGDTPTPQELRARADSITAQTKALRKDLLEWHESRLSEVGIARDRAAREQYAADQAAKSADIQVKREKAKVAELEKDAAEIEAAADAAEKKGDHRAAEEHRELAADYRNSSEIHAARARQAELDAAHLREEAAQHTRRVVELETQHDDLVKEGSAAAVQIDRMEDQARLLDEAADKLTMAEMLSNADVPGSLAEVDKRVTEVSSLQVEAEKALEQVNEMDIDHSKITKVLPDARLEVAPAPVSTEVDAEAPTGSSGAEAEATTGSMDAQSFLDPEMNLDDEMDLDTDLASSDADAGSHADAGSDLADTELEPSVAMAEADAASSGELDTEWLEDFIDDPPEMPDLATDFADVTVVDSGFDMEPAEVTFADAVAGSADDLADDGGIDDLG